MPRRSTGSVVLDERRASPVYALKFRAYGKRWYVTTEPPTTNRREAETQLRYILADVERGIWTPPERKSSAKSAAAVERSKDPTFREFAARWFDSKSSEWSENTRIDYQWQLSSHLLPFFGEHRLSEITVAEVDRYREAKMREHTLRAAAIEAARSKTNVREMELELRYARDLPGIAPVSINKTITRLGQVLDVADEYGLIGRNPVRVNPRNRRVKTDPPPAIWLDRASQIRALLDAAGEMDRRAPRGRNHIGRRAMLSTLVFAGLRLGEMLALRWRDVDLNERRLRVRAAKTASGVRYVDIAPALREALIVWKSEVDARINLRTPEGGEHRKIDPNSLVFATKEGTPFLQNNVRKRILDPAIALANRQLKDAGEAPLPEGLTPHKLRHTAISMWFAAGWFAAGSELPRVQAMAGHKRPEVTLGIYAHVMHTDETSRQQLRDLMGISGSSSGSSTVEMLNLGDLDTLEHARKPS